MRICLLEPCDDSDVGSIGAWYIAEHARRAGYEVDVLRKPGRGYDVELISLHHCRDFVRLARLPKAARIRIVGGHPMQNNPRPVIPFADAICVGEGESWIKQALLLLERYGEAECLRDLPGTIVSSRWEFGDSVPAANVERPLPENPPYLNREWEGRKKAWYVEMARGCPYRCAFCELGHSTPFRIYTKDEIFRCLDRADTRITRKINFYAPDEMSHPDYHELFAHLKERGYAASFSSMRIDSILRRGAPDLNTNHLIRVGIDGLTEKTRRRVNKAITNDMILEYFASMIGRGHTYFKMFYIFGYPWEELSDFDEFERSMSDLRMAIPLKKNIMLRIKWTPFIPQPCTPLAKAGSKYDCEMVDRIRIWHVRNKCPKDYWLHPGSPGWYVDMDGDVMGPRRYMRECELTSGDERLLQRNFTPLHRI